MVKQGEGANSADIRRRFIAYLLDWFLGALFIAFPVVMMNSIAFNTTNLLDDLILIQYPYNYIGGALALMFSFIYFVFIPLKVWRGQTPGKKIMSIQMVKVNDDLIDFKTLLLRQIVGIIIVEGMLVTSSSYLRQLLSLLSGQIWFLKYPYYIGLGLTTISFILVVFTHSHQAIHDYIGKTKVVNS